jgi:hypothetical protein
VRDAIAISALYSLVVVDALKVLCLALTSEPTLNACGCRELAAPNAAGGRACGGNRSLQIAGNLVRRMLRRAHKVLDVLVS